MSKRLFAVSLVLLFVALPCRADIIILKNGKSYKGELNHRNTIHLNPLSVEKITILLEKTGSKESKLVTFDADDVDQIILELGGVKEIIDLANLRQQTFTKKESENNQRDVLEQRGGAGTQENVETIESETLQLSEDALARWNRREKNKGIMLTGGGFLTLTVGVLMGFGEGNDLNAANYFLIGVGSSLIGYGIYKLIKVRTRGVEPNVQLNIDPEGTVGLSICWWF